VLQCRTTFITFCTSTRCRASEWLPLPSALWTTRSPGTKFSASQGRPLLQWDASHITDYNNVRTITHPLNFKKNQRTRRYWPVNGTDNNDLSTIWHCDCHWQSHSLQIIRSHKHTAIPKKWPTHQRNKQAFDNHSFILSLPDFSLLEPLKSSESHRIKLHATIFNFAPFPVCLLRMSLYQYLYQNCVQEAIFTGFVHVKGAISL
jgi:hypothetical protein